MTGKECAVTWRKIVAIYKEDISKDDARPAYTMNRILAEMDPDSVRSAFAAVAAVKQYDGRISSRNRKFLSEATIPDECMVWNHSNPMVYAGVDDVHMAHVDNLVTELKKRWEDVTSKLSSLQEMIGTFNIENNASADIQVRLCDETWLSAEDQFEVITGGAVYSNYISYEEADSTIRNILYGYHMGMTDTKRKDKDE